MKYYKYNVHDLSDTEYEKYLAMASEKRRARIEKKSDADRRLSVCAEMMLRREIAAVYSVNEEDIIIENDPSGAPAVLGMDVFVSISHSHDYAVCAISERRVGIDIEKIRSIPTRVAERTLSPDESAYLSQGAGDAQRRFYEIWTAKEAYAKMTGHGISLHNTPDTSKLSCVSHEYFDDYVIAIANEE